LWARDALEQAIRTFDGTVLFVSHDRYFVNRVADHLLVVDPQRVRVVEGNYETYQRMKRPAETAADAPSLQKAVPPAASATKKPATSDTKRRRRFPYRKVADLEAEILEKETEIENLHTRLADGATHRDGELVRNLKRQIDEQQAALGTLYEHWEEAVELNW
jgi:ATP-binding cassette subfamily F protein 3